MIEIKVIAPSVDKLKAASSMSESAVNDCVIANNYLRLMADSLEEGGYKSLYFTQANMTQDGITAKVNTTQLPKYNSVTSWLGSMNFEQEMLAHIQEYNQKYGDDCPIATNKEINAPIMEWSAHWIAIYLWTIMRGCYTYGINKYATDMMTHEDLMALLVTEQTEKSPNERGDLSKVAAQYLDSRHIDAIFREAVAESLVAAEDSSKTPSELATEKRQIVSRATKHVLTMAGYLLENIKANDDFFNDDK